MTDLTATLAERGARYGKFEDHAVIAQGLKDQMWATEGWSRLAPDQRQALEVIQDKVARILNGDPDYTDNWHDIAGYSRLVEDRLTERAAAMAKWDEPVRNIIDPKAPFTIPVADDPFGEQQAPEPGWIEWTGGVRPVPKRTLVDARLRNGEQIRAWSHALRWWCADNQFDVVAYRLSTKQD